MPGPVSIVGHKLDSEHSDCINHGIVWSLGSKDSDSRRDLILCPSLNVMHWIGNNATGIMSCLSAFCSPLSLRETGGGALFRAQYSDCQFSVTLIDRPALLPGAACNRDTKPMLVYSVSIWIFNQSWIGFINIDQIDHIHSGLVDRACHVILGAGVVLNLKLIDIFWIKRIFYWPCQQIETLYNCPI